MNKKKITKLQFIKNAIKHSRELTNNNKINNLKYKLYTESDKHNWCYQHFWLGEPILQTPEDIVKMQDIIFKEKPDLIIEIGVAWGGMILLYDTLAKSIPIRKIVGVDIFMPKNLKFRLNKKISDKVKLIKGSSLNNKIFYKISKIRNNYKKCLVHLDSDHTEEHVLKELNLYDNIIKKGDIVIVGDTVLNYIPENKFRVRKWSRKNNPKTALDNFLKKNKKYKLLKEWSNNLLLSNNIKSHIKKLSQ
jgi:cephalosporin hydroxylase